MADAFVGDQVSSEKKAQLKWDWITFCSKKSLQFSCWSWFLAHFPGSRIFDCSSCPKCVEQSDESVMVRHQRKVGRWKKLLNAGTHLIVPISVTFYVLNNKPKVFEVLGIINTFNFQLLKYLHSRFHLPIAMEVNPDYALWQTLGAFDVGLGLRKGMELVASNQTWACKRNPFVSQLKQWPAEWLEKNFRCLFGWFYDNICFGGINSYR